MRWKSFALALIYCLSAIQPVLAEERSIKATTPVDVSLYPVTAVKQGKRATFEVYATCAIPSDDFVIEIQPGEGSELIKGSLQWQGSVVPGEPVELKVTLLMAEDSVPTVSVTSGIRIEGEIRFAASATYEQESRTPGAENSNARKRNSQRKGRQVVEYPVK